MNKTDKELLDDLTCDFVTLAKEKYNRGVEEHGGNMIMNPSLFKEAKHEIIDLWFYIGTLERQNKMLYEQMKNKE